MSYDFFVGREGGSLKLGFARIPNFNWWTNTAIISFLANIWAYIPNYAHNKNVAKIAKIIREVFVFLETLKLSNTLQKQQRLKREDDDEAKSDDEAMSIVSQTIDTDAAINNFSSR